MRYTLRKKQNACDEKVQHEEQKMKLRSFKNKTLTPISQKSPQDAKESKTYLPKVMSHKLTNDLESHIKLEKEAGGLQVKSQFKLKKDAGTPKSPSNENSTADDKSLNLALNNELSMSVTPEKVLNKELLESTTPVQTVHMELRKRATPVQGIHNKLLKSATQVQGLYKELPKSATPVQCHAGQGLQTEVEPIKEATTTPVENCDLSGSGQLGLSAGVTVLLGPGVASNVNLNSPPEDVLTDNNTYVESHQKTSTGKSKEQMSNRETTSDTPSHSLRANPKKVQHFQIADPKCRNHNSTINAIDNIQVKDNGSNFYKDRDSLGQSKQSSSKKGEDYNDNIEGIRKEVHQKQKYRRSSAASLQKMAKGEGVVQKPRRSSSVSILKMPEEQEGISQSFSNKDVDSHTPAQRDQIQYKTGKKRGQLELQAKLFGAEESANKDVPKVKTSRRSLVVDVGEKDSNECHLVWARLGNMKWWPGIVVRGIYCGMAPARPGYSWIFWYGDHKVSQVSLVYTDLF